MKKKENYIKYFTDNVDEFAIKYIVNYNGKEFKNGIEQRNFIKKPDKSGNHKNF